VGKLVDDGVIGANFEAKRSAPAETIVNELGDWHVDRGHLPLDRAPVSPPVATVATPVRTPPPPPPATSDPITTAVGMPGAMGRAGFNPGSTKALAGDLAARVPQLVEAGLRGGSKVRARKVRRVVRHIDPWSVLTFSVLFHLCVYSAFLLASVLVWNAADAAGTISNVENFIRELGDYQTFEINGDAVFRAAMIIAGVLTLASTVLVVLLTVIFNLISDLIGGIRVTVIEEETVRVHRSSR
jgi:Transmembrane domain of unknown function (DUF3566)